MAKICKNNNAFIKENGFMRKALLKTIYLLMIITILTGCGQVDSGKSDVKRRERTTSDRSDKDNKDNKEKKKDKKKDKNKDKKKDSDKDNKEDDKNKDKDKDKTSDGAVIDKDDPDYYKGAKELELYDYSGNLIYTFGVPEGYKIEWVSEGGVYFELSNAGDYIYISVYASDFLYDYIYNGTMPDEKWYPGFEGEYAEYNEGDVTYFIVDYSYDLQKGSRGRFVNVVIPYENVYGSMSMAEVRLPYGISDDVKISDDEIIDIAHVVMNIE